MDTVTFDLPPRFTTANTLVATFQPSVQRVQSLTVDQAKNVSTDYTNQQWIFNLEPMDYMQTFGKSAIEELSATIESQVAENCILGHAYRFFGDGVTQINSYGQLANALAFYRNYGAPKGNLKGYLSDLAVPNIVNSGLNQFAIDRNNDDAQSWMVGNFRNCDWYESNFLPVHTAGNVGEDGLTLTVVSTNDPTGTNITQLTCSGASASDLDAIHANDLMYFIDGVSGQPNLRYLTFIGHKVSGNPVQIRATGDAASNGGGQVTFNISAGSAGQGLTSVANQNQNILYNIVAGMQLKVLPSHRRGLISGGNALYLAMPKLPDEDPFKTVSESNPETGVSMRIYYGSLFGQNQRGMVHDCIWGSTAVDEYQMAMIFPL